MATTVRNTTALSSLQATDAVYIERSGAAVGNHVEMTNFGLDISARLSISAAQSIATGALTQIAVNTIDFDTDGMSDLANNRLVIQSAGKYLLGLRHKWASNSTGERYARVAVGAAAVAEDRRSAVFDSEVSIASPVLQLSAGAAVTASVLQASGGALNLVLAQLWAVRIAP